MTVTTEIASISYPGNGVQTVFAFNFLIPNAGAARVAVVDVNGVTTIVSPSAYTITGLGNAGGGAVQFPLFGSPINSQTRLVIFRDVLYVQNTSVANQGFYPATLEQVGDYLTLQTQQLAEMAARSLQGAPGETVGYMPAASARAGLFLAFDGAGNPIAVPGTGGGGSTAWNSISAKPDIVTAFQNLTPGAGQIIEYTGPNSAHMIPTPGGGGGGAVSSVNARTGAVVLTADDVDGAPLFGQTVRSVLQAGPNITIGTPDPVTGVSILSSTGGGGSGNMQPRLLSDYGAIDGGGVNTASNNAAFAAAEAAGDTAVYIPDGKYATTRTESQFTKHYVGRGTILFTTSANDLFPAGMSYAATKPTPAAVQGRTGWFGGDQRFTEQGWQIIGPDVRTYGLASTDTYFFSPLIPKNEWFDVMSGNSGSQGWMLSGGSIGQTVIPLAAPANAAWVGKTVGIGNYGGGLAESHLVTAVNTAGNNITIAGGLANNYTWNPSASQIPGIFFSLRTWAGWEYVKVTATGGGDVYGHNVRMNGNYVGNATETHPFMRGTYSQYGGDVYGNADGIYLQSWESQLQGQTYDLSGQSFVQSMVRNNDTSLANNVWTGTFFQSTGVRPCDACHVILGNWRNGLDTVFSSFYETTMLVGSYSPGNFVVTLKTVNGAHPGDPIIIGAEALTINSVNVGAKQIGLTTVMAGSHSNGELVTFPKGGAAVNAKLGHRMVLNSGLSSTERGGDPLGVFSTPYGNVQGDLIFGSDTDGSGDFLVMRWARGNTAALPDTARMRMRPTGFQFFGTGGHSFAGTSVSLAAGCALNLSTGSLLTLGSGCFIFSDGTFNYSTSPGGGTHAF